jgi:hypothetical protein
VERRVPEADEDVFDPRHALPTEHQGAAIIGADGADLKVYAKNVHRRPSEGDSLIGPAIQEVDARLVRASPGLKREALAWEDAGSEVEEALAPELWVGGDELRLR